MTTDGPAPARDEGPPAPALRHLPRSWLAVGALGALREFALPLAVGGLSRLRGGVSPLDAALGAAALALVGVVAWVRWRSVRWGLVGERLVVHRGVVEKSRRELPLARIVGVQVEEPVAWRLLGLARLRVQTASGAGDDAVIDAVPRADVAALVATLTAHAHDGTVAGDDAAPATDTPDPRTSPADALDARLGTAPPRSGVLLHRASTTDLALAGLTGSALTGIGAIVAVLGRFLDDLGLDRRAIEWVGDRGAPLVESLGRELLPLLVVGGALALLVVALPLAAALSVVRHGNLVVTRERGAIVRRAGLLQRSERRSPADAVQGLRLVASPVRRLVRGAALRIVTAAPAGGDDDDEGAGGATLELVPLVRGEARIALAEAVLPGAGALLRAPWRRIGVARVAVWRAAIAGLVAIAAVAGAAPFLPAAWRVVAWLALVPVAVLAALHVDGRRRTALAADTDAPLLGVAWGSVGRTTALVDPATAQSVVRSAGPLQRAAGLCTLRVALADGDDVVVPDVPVPEAEAIERRIRAATSRVLAVSVRPRPHQRHAPLPASP